MVTPVAYDEIARAVEPTGMIARGGFVPREDDDVPLPPDGRAVRTVVVIGNAGGAIWPRFRREQPSGPDPLDTWTRTVLAPIAERFGAHLVHPSDQPYQPFQRWARRADDVWPSPLGLLIHPDFGLWHAYRGALLFADAVVGLPSPTGRRSPCVDCVAQPCLSACPVDAIGLAGFDHVACGDHVRSGVDPRCTDHGCAARRACPVAAELRYDADQMAFHMRAFAGLL